MIGMNKGGQCKEDGRIINSRIAAESDRYWWVG